MWLYYWDWNNIGTIQRVKVDEFPFSSKSEGEKQHCYTTLDGAILGAKIDIRAQIVELQKQLTAVENTTMDNVEEVDYI
jgi:hypothetical protein